MPGRMLAAHVVPALVMLASAGTVGSIPWARPSPLTQLLPRPRRDAAALALCDSPSMAGALRRRGSGSGSCATV